jgi:uncharacterized protein YlxW (UPF0749 family)
MTKNTKKDSKTSLLNVIMTIFTAILKYISSKRKIDQQAEEERFQKAQIKLTQSYKDIDAKKNRKKKNVKDISNNLNNRF